MSSVPLRRCVAASVRRCVAASLHRCTAVPLRPDLWWPPACQARCRGAAGKGGQRPSATRRPPLSLVSPAPPAWAGALIPRPLIALCRRAVGDGSTTLVIAPPPPRAAGEWAWPTEARLTQGAVRPPGRAGLVQTVRTRNRRQQGAGRGGRVEGSSLAPRSQGRVARILHGEMRCGQDRGISTSNAASTPIPPLFAFRFRSSLFPLALRHVTSRHVPPCADVAALDMLPLRARSRVTSLPGHLLGFSSPTARLENSDEGAARPVARTRTTVQCTIPRHAYSGRAIRVRYGQHGTKAAVEFNVKTGLRFVQSLLYSIAAVGGDLRVARFGSLRPSRPSPFLYSKPPPCSGDLP